MDGGYLFTFKKNLEPHQCLVLFVVLAQAQFLLRNHEQRENRADVTCYSGEVVIVVLQEGTTVVHHHHHPPTTVIKRLFCRL